VGGAQDGRRADFDTRESAEFELADARAARGMLQTDFVRGRPGEEADVVRAGPPAEGDAVSIKVMAQTPLGYALLVNRLAPRGCTHLLHPPPSAPTPLTRPPLPPWRNSQYDGLVYHSEVFDDPPRVGAVAQAWVSKVRRRAQRCFQTQLLCPSARAGARAAVSSPGCARSGARSGSHRARRVAH
jgi:hypothetical protein